MPSNTHILIVEDDRHVRTSLREIIEEAGHQVVEARNGKEALDHLDKNAFDLVLLDLELPRVHGMDVLKQAINSYPDMPVVIVSGKATIRMAVEATRFGAYDVIEKPIDLNRIQLTLRNAIEKRRLIQRHVASVTDIHEQYGMIGTSPVMQRVYRLIDRASATQTRVLITGENGAGKELVARAIHQNSDRQSHPFIDINCAALPEQLIESELFGYEKGAFTGAVAPQAGKFEHAQGGTLFLDEIGDMSLVTQAKILRALSDETVRRVGSDHNIPLDVRIITATNKDLEQAMQSGDFREDLYYRLRVIPIHMPSLREHMEDLPDLVRFFLHQICDEMNLTVCRLTPDALALLLAHNWPGNIRELRNVIERLVALKDQEEISAPETAEALSRNPSEPNAPPTDLRLAREKFERKHIMQILQAWDWKIQETADALGIQRSHLWKKMQQYDIERQEIDRVNDKNDIEN